MKRLTRFMLLALSLAPLTTIAADACSLLTKAEAGKLIGSKGEVSTMAIPSTLDRTGGQMGYCAYSVAASNTLSLVVSITEYHSNKEAKQKLTPQVAHGRLNDSAATVTEEGDLGDETYYASSADGATYVFVKDNKVIGVAIGGAAGKAAGAKKQLLRAAQLAAGRV